MCMYYKINVCQETMVVYRSISTNNYSETNNRPPVFRKQSYHQKVHRQHIPSLQADFTESTIFALKYYLVLLFL